MYNNNNMYNHVILGILVWFSFECQKLIGFALTMLDDWL